MIRFIVESRDLAADAPLARAWTPETITMPPPLWYQTRAEAQQAIAAARRLGGPWARAEYRVRQSEIT